jgi:hypothetical protein
VDLDGDSITDLISGSYTGGITFYKGLGQGQFAEATQILPKNVKYDNGELALSPCGGDWDGDGDTDLVVGQISGPVRLMLNDGKGNFSRRGNLGSEGKDIEAADGGPCITDWNGDGILDLLLGDDHGNVIFYPGKTKGSLDLGKREFLLAERKPNDAWKVETTDPKSPTGMTARRPGARTKPFAADWNGDGKLDLLVGDFMQISPPARKLTPAEQKNLAAMKSELPKVRELVNEIHTKTQELALKEIGAKAVPGDDPKAMEKYFKAFDKHFQALSKKSGAPQRLAKLTSDIGKLEPRQESTGRVWVYLRK